MRIFLGILFLLIMLAAYTVVVVILHNYWLHRQRNKLWIQRNFDELLSYSEHDLELTMALYQKLKPCRTVFDETVAAHPEIDPRDLVRRRKEQDAHDQETLDKATEFHNDIGK